MSLINDALRRAKTQTVQSTPAPNLQLRPADRIPDSSTKTPVLFTLVFVSVILAAAILTPILANRFKEGTRIAGTVDHSAARRPVELQPIPDEKPTQVAVTTRPGASAPVPELNSATTNAVVEQKPAPALKLNGILYQTRNPSAIVNGKTVYQNGHVGEFQVSSITPSSVVLINGSFTNVLKLQE